MNRLKKSVASLIAMFSLSGFTVADVSEMEQNLMQNLQKKQNEMKQLEQMQYAHQNHYRHQHKNQYQYQKHDAGVNSVDTTVNSSSLRKTGGKGKGR